MIGQDKNSVTIKETRTVDEEVLSTESSGVAELLSKRTSATADDHKLVGQVRSGSRQGIASVSHSSDIVRRRVDRKTSRERERKERVIGNSMAIGHSCVLSGGDGAR